ncbi:hypothetical protein IQ07DRAFT_645651 [Pyrenochaeta sp. DS3sAY3a]|nr:hypothetical protein IQ07DRAFT_645651 [Pyrenochaeta sp. DS3sAY3a]
MVYKYVPVDPSWQRRAVSQDSDLKGPRHGVFATANISEGVRIMSEPPLIHLMFAEDVESLVGSYLNLTTAEQRGIEDINPADISSSPLLKKLEENMRPLLARTLALINKPFAELTKGEAKELQRTSPILENHIIAFRLVARWHTSCHLIDNALAPGEQDVGFFASTSLLRHSCVPNAYTHFNAQENRMTVHTMRAIAEGEELTVCTLPQGNYQRPRSRTRTLKKHLGIECACPACFRKGEAFTPQRRARALCYMHAAHLNTFLTTHTLNPVEVLLEEARLGGVSPFSQHVASPGAFEEAERLAVRLVGLLQERGVALEAVRWINALLDRVQPGVLIQMGPAYRPRHFGVMAWRAGVAEEWVRGVLGDDVEEVGEMRRRGGLLAAAGRAGERREG